MDNRTNMTTQDTLPHTNHDASRQSLGYTADSAMSFYDQLEDVAAAKWDIRQKYSVLRDIFKRVVNQGTAQSSINFIGLFAKLDYLTKQHNIPDDAAMQIHDTRRTLNRIHDTDDDTLAASLPYDIRATAVLVSYVSGGTPVPQSVERLFPTRERKRKWSKFDINRLRCIVESWDDSYIYATEELNRSQLKVCYGHQNRYLSRNGKGDWTYLGQILQKDTQLNLVRIRMEEDVCMPELIIFEPDYLIDVTTVASCFETYAESPFVSMVNKLKPQPNTASIHLGNLAGRFLDDTVHHRNITFKDSIMEFFKENSISITSCDDMNDNATVAQFYQNARSQKQNIEKLVGHDLPNEIGEYDAKAVVLEPTFFSEVLGIQGRLDFLHDKDGNTSIIEQKSGKGAFVPYTSPEYDPNRPLPQEKHLVQLALYRALFYYEFQMHSSQLRHFMLLYSKYKEGLVSTAIMPELTLRAIRMRNLLAWCEMTYTQDGMRILKHVTPEMLNKKGLAGRLWDEWTRPELARLLDPIGKASPLERAYYFRFMQFIAREHLLSKVGNKSKDDSGFAAIWLDTIEDKRAAGNIYEDMTIYSFGTDGSMVKSLKLRFASEQSADTSNFRKGDIVILYPYHRGAVPNACAQMVNRASIRDITAEGIDVVLRNSQTDRKVFDSGNDTRWAIEHDMFESSSRTLYSGMHRFLSASQERRNLILCQRKPSIDTSRHAKGEYGRFNTLVERAKQACDLFLVIGPPGTGKTSFGLLNILREELADEHSNIVLLSYTNRAVDEICGKLTENGIDFLRIGSELNCDAAYHEHLLANRMLQCLTSKEVKEMIGRTRVFCATTAALNANTQLFRIKHFDLAIIDEASQILEPHLIGLLSAAAGGRNAIGRTILIGDHKQLPAVVQQTEGESAVTEPELRAIGLTDCRHSLFERLLANFKTDDGYDPRYVYMLTRQGRMHEDIAEFPNYAFYGNRLAPVPLDHQTLPCLPTDEGNGIAQMLSRQRVAFVASPKPAVSASVKTNTAEAEMIAATVVQIYRMEKNTFDVMQTVGVIVPYRNQIATIRNAIDSYGIAPLHDITIDTVERYQGSQRDYIIYGFTVQQYNQLNFLTNNVFEEDGMVIDRKLNVAMTRARLHLVLVGNPDILVEDFTFYKLLWFLRCKGCYLDVPKDDYCCGHFSITSGKDGIDGECRAVNEGMTDRLLNAFTQEVESRLKTDERTVWPDGILGNSDAFNKALVNYGRSAFSDSATVFSRTAGRNITISAYDQTLLYCHYFTPKHYIEAKAAFQRIECTALSKGIGTDGCVRMIDIGCGPATDGIAFAEQFCGSAKRIEYIGIDTSEAMRNIAGRLLATAAPDTMTWQLYDSVEWIGDSVPTTDREAPSLTVFNLSHFFACADGRFAENLAANIAAMAEKDKPSMCIAVIRQSAYDARMRSYTVFKKCMEQYAKTVTLIECTTAAI